MRAREGRHILRRRTLSSSVIDGERSGECARRHLPLRAWLLLHLDPEFKQTVSGAEWIDKSKGIFRLPWLHGSSKTWTAKNNDMFLQWAKHTGKHSFKKTDNPKKWKTNFRCAINSLSDIKPVQEHTVNRGPQACKVYRFTDSRKLNSAYNHLRNFGYEVVDNNEVTLSNSTERNVPVHEYHHTSDEELSDLQQCESTDEENVMAVRSLISHTTTSYEASVPWSCTTFSDVCDSSDSNIDQFWNRSTDVGSLELASLSLKYESSGSFTCEDPEDELMRPLSPRVAAGLTPIVTQNLPSIDSFLPTSISREEDSLMEEDSFQHNTWGL